MSIEKLDLLVQTAIPTVYQQGMSFYEVLNLVTNKVNEMVEDVNEYMSTDLTAYVENLMTEWLTDGTFDTLIANAMLAIGDRTYTEQNIVTDNETITASLDALDVHAGAQAAEQAILKTRIERVYDLVTDFGAVGDGNSAALDTAAFNAFIAAAADGDTLFIPKGHYNFNATLALAAHDITIRGDGIGRTILDFSALPNDSIMLSVFGSESAAVSLSANAATGDKTISATFAGLAKGDFIRVFSDRQWSLEDSASRAGEIQIVESYSNGTISITSGANDGGLFDYYDIADNARVAKLTMINNFVMEDITMIGGGVGSSHFAVQLGFHNKPVVRRCEFIDFELRAVMLRQCFGGLVQSCRVNGSNLAGLGYGVAVNSATRNTIITDCIFYNCRHGVTHGGSDGQGIPRFSIVKGCHAINCIGAGFDCHSESEFITFDGCKVQNSVGGFALSGRESTVINCEVVGTSARGIDSRGTNNRIINNYLKRCGGVAVYIYSAADLTADSTGTTVKGNKIIDTNNHAIHVLNTGHVQVNDNYLVNIPSGAFRGVYCQNNLGAPVEFIQVNNNFMQDFVVGAYFIAEDFEYIQVRGNLFDNCTTTINGTAAIVNKDVDDNLPLLV